MPRVKGRVNSESLERINMMNVLQVLNSNQVKQLFQPKLWCFPKPNHIALVPNNTVTI